MKPDDMVGDSAQQKRSEEALRTVERKYRSLVETTDTGYVILDDQGRVLDANQEYVRLTGRDRLEDILGHSVLEWTAPYDHARNAAEVRKCVEQGSVRNLVIDYISPSGKNTPVEINATVLRTGGEWSILSLCRDITERRQVEKSLKDSVSRLKATLESTADGILVVDNQGRISDFNEQFARLWRIPQEILDLHDDQKALNFVLDQLKDPDQFMAKVRDLYVQPEMVSFDVLEFRDGRVFERYSQPQKIDGQSVGRVWSFRNITERKHAEDALRRSEEHYRELFSAITDAVFVYEVGPEGFPGRFLEVNEVASARLGYTSREFLQMSPLDIDASGTGLDISAVSKKVLAGEVVTFEQIHVAKDGRRIPVETNSRLFNLGTRPVVLSFVRDITERKTAEAHQRELEAERLKTQKIESIGTLAGGIAHDFNNLLQGIFGYISMAKITYDQKDKSLAMLKQAEEALHLAVNLTAQLLTFAKGGKPVKKLMGLMPTIENAVKFSLSGSHTGYLINVAADLWPVEADEGQLAQVIQNIVLNANEAMAGLATVNVVLENANVPKDTIIGLPEGGRFVRITIQDSGIGIPGRDLSRIFDPYFTTKQKGSGLGLATSYSIIKNHGGVIQVKSELSKGSTFMIYLPAAKGIAAEKEASAQAPVGGRKGRVLFMDDEELIRNVAGEMIAALGHEVENAADGKAAIELFIHAREAGRPFDIVILDLTVKGGMGGEETLSRLLDIDPGILAVVSSGYADNASLGNYREHGFSASLSKPYKIEALRDCLNSLLK